MISHKEKRRQYRFAEAVLRPRLEARQIEAVIESMASEINAIEPSVPRLKAPSSKMTIKIGAGVAAFYRSLPDDLSEEEKRELVKLFVDEYMKGQLETPVAQFVWGSRFLHRLYRRLWILTANWYDEPEGWRFELIPPAEGLYYGMNVTRCGLVKFMDKQGLSELTPLICQGDHQAQPYLPYGVTFKRSQTLADGSDHCDFRYYETGWI